MRQRKVDIIHMVFRESYGDIVCLFVWTFLDFIDRQMCVTNNVPLVIYIIELIALMFIAHFFFRSHTLNPVITLTHVNIHSYLT